MPGALAWQLQCLQHGEMGDKRAAARRRAKDGVKGLEKAGPVMGAETTSSPVRGGEQGADPPLGGSGATLLPPL